jgi:hypothetical protein
LLAKKDTGRLLKKAPALRLLGDHIYTIEKEETSE